MICTLQRRSVHLPARVGSNRRGTDWALHRVQLRSLVSSRLSSVYAPRSIYRDAHLFFYPPAKTSPKRKGTGWVLPSLISRPAKKSRPPRKLVRLQYFIRILAKCPFNNIFLFLCSILLLVARNRETQKPGCVRRSLARSNARRGRNRQFPARTAVDRRVNCQAEGNVLSVRQIGPSWSRDSTPNSAGNLVAS